jgi:general stress protein 13
MNYKIGDIIQGTISGIKPYGVFIKFENNFAFCHISNCSHKFIKNLNDLFLINQEIKAKIIEINSEINKINVSIKDCEDNVPIKNISNIDTKSPVQFTVKEPSKPSFEDMMKSYLKISDEKLESIGKRNQKHIKR